jgi:hypothetical protein
VVAAPVAPAAFVAADDGADAGTEEEAADEESAATDADVGADADAGGAGADEEEEGADAAEASLASDEEEGGFLSPAPPMIPLLSVEVLGFSGRSFAASFGAAAAAAVAATAASSLEAAAASLSLAGSATAAGAAVVKDARNRRDVSKRGAMGALASAAGPNTLRVRTVMREDDAPFTRANEREAALQVTGAIGVDAIVWLRHFATVSGALVMRPVRIARKYEERRELGAVSRTIKMRLGDAK